MNNNKKHLLSTPIYQSLFGFLFVIILFVSFIFYPPIVALIIIFIFFFKFIKKNESDRFLKLQSILPTSKIQSIAMGLVEIKGKIKAIKRIESPFGNINCIGYQYIIKQEYRDRKGRQRLETLENTTICNDFYIEDQTGRVNVTGKDLNFLWMPEQIKIVGKKHYFQYLLTDNMEMLLIGKATLENHQIIIAKEPIKNIFMIAPVNKVNKWNANKPLLTSFYIVLAIFFGLVVCILFADITLTGKIVKIVF